jgi:hypothetical protein
MTTGWPTRSAAIAQDLSENGHPVRAPLDRPGAENADPGIAGCCAAEKA